MTKHDGMKATNPKARNMCNHIRSWLTQPTEPFQLRYGYTPGMDASISASPWVGDGDQEEGSIVLVQQFYVAQDPERHLENQQCLRRNLANPLIDRIVLHNEREYTDEELGVVAAGSKLEQLIIGRRLTYLDAFASDAVPANAYIVLANSDIFFDRTLANVRRSGLRATRRVLCQLRHEYEHALHRDNLDACKPFGEDVGFRAQPNSQDVWIWHRSHQLPPALSHGFNVALGTPGCDNAVAHRFGTAGFERANAPAWVKCFHHHASSLRGYAKATAERAARPHHMVIPAYGPWVRPLRTLTLDRSVGGAGLVGVIQKARAAGKPFLLPRLAGVENDVAALGAELTQCGRLPAQKATALDRSLEVAKRNAGIDLRSWNAAREYAAAYLGAFERATAYFCWAPWGNVTRYYNASFAFVEANMRAPQLDAGVLDVYDSVHSVPWTHALRGMRILIVSAFCETIKRQLDAGRHAYGVDLFPECTFVFLKPPQTQGDQPARAFKHEFKRLTQRVHAIKDTFDVALCSCGGYGNPLCSYIHQVGKSAVYVGGVLQMYFGILGTRWERERPDIVRAYHGPGWTRPSESERPAGHASIEKGCYW